MFLFSPKKLGRFFQFDEHIFLKWVETSGMQVWLHLVEIRDIIFDIIMPDVSRCILDQCVIHLLHLELEAGLA